MYFGDMIPYYKVGIYTIQWELRMVQNFVVFMDRSATAKIRTMKLSRDLIMD